MDCPAQILIIPSAAGAGVELARLAIIVWQGITQLIFALQPEALFAVSDVKTKVKQREVFAAVCCKVNGKSVPVYVCNNGAVVELPSYTYKKSALFSKLNCVKTNLIILPGVEGQKVFVKFCELL